jgi:DNA-binding CsgD family transcriptional regulator
MKAKAQVELTLRELEVVQLICQEYTASAIAAHLGISPRTVEAHKWNIMQKIRAKSSIGIFKFALKNGIFKLD